MDLGSHTLLMLFSRLVRSAVCATLLALRLLTSVMRAVIGAIVVMMGITIANMRKGVLLHKLIFLEVSAPDKMCPIIS